MAIGCVVTNKDGSKEIYMTDDRVFTVLVGGELTADEVDMLKSMDAGLVPDGYVSIDPLTN